MRKFLPLFLIILLMVPMLSGCFCPYWNDWGGRGYRYDRGHHEDSGHNGQRGGYRDYRERR